MSELNGLPWLIGGDFNEVLFEKEKEGSFQKTDSGMNAFHDALFQCDLMDIGWSGTIFAWSNRRFKDGLLKERFDRFLGFLDWFNRFPNFEVFNLDSIGSDHSPILVKVVGLEIVLAKKKKLGSQISF